jgi:hypothetical protein
MAAVHEGWIAELLKDVSSDDKGTLIELLSQMKQHLNDSDGSAPAPDGTAR